MPIQIVFTHDAEVSVQQVIEYIVEKLKTGIPDIEHVVYSKNAAQRMTFKDSIMVDLVRGNPATEHDLNLYITDEGTTRVREDDLRVKNGEIKPKYKEHLGRFIAYLAWRVAEKQKELALRAQEELKLALANQEKERLEKIRQEEIRQEELRQEELRQEELRQEELRQEQIRQQEATALQEQSRQLQETLLHEGRVNEHNQQDQVSQEHPQPSQADDIYLTTELNAYAGRVLFNEYHLAEKSEQRRVALQALLNVPYFDEWAQTKIEVDDLRSQRSKIISALDEYASSEPKAFTLTSCLINSKVNREVAKRIATDLNHANKGKEGAFLTDAYLRKVRFNVVEQLDEKEKANYVQREFSSRLMGLITPAREIFKVTTLEAKKEQLKATLMAYTLRAAQAKPFAFFNSTRQKSRMINIRLADEVKSQLNKCGTDLAHLFSEENIKNMRERIIKDIAQPDFRDTGMNSKELARAFKLGRELFAASGGDTTSVLSPS